MKRFLLGSLFLLLGVACIFSGVLTGYVEIYKLLGFSCFAVAAVFKISCFVTEGASLNATTQRIDSLCTRIHANKLHFELSRYGGFSGNINRGSWST